MCIWTWRYCSLKRRRNAWTDYLDDQQQLQFSVGPASLDPLRTILLKALSGSKTERLKLAELVEELSSVSDEALVKTIEEARHDGVISLDGDTVGLTTLGHRASLTLR